MPPDAFAKAASPVKFGKETMPAKIFAPPLAVDQKYFIAASSVRFMTFTQMLVAGDSVPDCLNVGR